MLLGIDTSCYTTSLAAVERPGNLVADCRLLLSVEKGKRGMAQSEGFFHHVLQLPMLMEQLFSLLPKGPKSLSGVIVSTRPRPQEGSYMPVFRAGESMAKAISQSLQLPLFATSHQEGHIQAALWSCGEEAALGEEFLAVHLSGGTSEILRVQRQVAGFAIEILATADLAAGQLIDRVGVALGLDFPAGPHLENLAQTCPNPNLTIRSTVKAGQLFFSGPYTAAMRLLADGADPAELAHTVLKTVAKALAKALLYQMEATGLRKVLLAGGVMANRIIRESLLAALAPKAQLYFAKPAFSGDNAVGVAMLGLKMLS